MIDTHKHRGKRRLLAQSLREKGIVDPHVLFAIEQVPRHFFLDSSFEEHAYQDKAFPIGCDQTISHPYTVALQTQLMGLSPGDKVLEIGTGSGYQTAVLVHMKLQVYSIERQSMLFKKAQLMLPKIQLAPKKLIFGDGFIGYAQAAPYQGIIVTAGAPEVPKALMAQLAIGGKLVIPVGMGTQEMMVLTRVDEKSFERETHGQFAFVPMLADKK